MALSTKLRENTVDVWNTSLEDALDYRRRYGRESQWGPCEALFYQAHHMQDKNVGPNILFSTGDSLLSTLCVPNPFYLVKPLRMDLLNSCPVLESVLNGFVDALELKDVLEQMALSAYLYGVGIGKIGYDSEFGYDPSNDIGQQMGNVLGISLSQFDKKGQKIEYSSLVTPGMPWVQPVLPHDFVVPWGVRRLCDSPWCAHRIIRHIDDIRADPKYENKKDLAPQMSMSDWVKSYMTIMKPYRAGKPLDTARREDSDKAEFVELWEIHDTRTGRVMVVSQGYDKFLRNEIDYLQEDGLPFVQLSFVPSSRTFWTTPDAAYLLTSQEEAIDIAQMMKNQRRISLLRFLYKRGTITKDELSKFMSGEIGIGVEYENDDTGGQPPVTAVTPSNNNQVLQNEAEFIRRDARETVGFSRNQLGEYEQTGRRTATEAGIVQQKSDQRLTRREDQMATAYCDIGRKLAKTVFKFWKTPRLTEIIGQDGALEWSAFTGSDLKGEYLYKVGFSSEPIETKQAREQRAMTLYTQLSMDPTIDPIALRRMLVRAFNDPDFTSLFKPGVVSNANLPGAVQQLQQQMGGANPQQAPQAQAGGNVQKMQSKQTPGKQPSTQAASPNMGQ